MLKTLKFKSSVLFRTHTLLDRSLTILQFVTHLSKITANDSKQILERINQNVNQKE